MIWIRRPSRSPWYLRWIEIRRNVDILADMPIPPNILLINAQMALTSNRVLVVVQMLMIPSLAAAPVKEVNQSNCVAGIEEGTPRVMADSARVRRTIRHRILGRDPGRSSGAIGAMGNTERAKIRRNNFSEKRSSAVSLTNFAFFANAH